jgi:uncharacterized protein (DUF4415 family)
MNGRTRRPLDARSAAEAAFKAMTTKTAPTATAHAAAPSPRPTVPGAKEQVSLRLDQDVLDHFRAGGPGWQDRINTALRRAAGK